MSRPALGIVAACLVAVAVGAGLWLTGRHDGDRRVWVDLPDAAGLRTGSQVKIGGVPVGVVDKLEITARDTARAQLRIHRSDGPVGTDAQAWVRPANLLGEKYIDLHVGDRRRPLPEDGTIPAARTRTPVEVDQIVDVLTPETRARLAVLLREAGIAVAGRGADLGRTITALPPSFDDAAALLDEATADNRRLRGLLGRADALAASVAPDRDALSALVRDAATALRVAAGRRAQVDGALAAAPTTLAQLRTTLARLQGASAALRPAAVGLDRTAAPLTATLRSLPAFTASARPALGGLRAATPQLTRLADELAPTLRRLRPTSRGLAGLGTDTDRLSGGLDRAAPDLLGLLQAWASAIQPRDGLGHLFRAQAIIDPDMVRAITRYIIGPTPAARRRRPSATRPSATPADPVRTTVQAVPKIVDRLPHTPVDAGKAVEPVVDGTKKLLDFLLRP